VKNNISQQDLQTRDFEDLLRDPDVNLDHGTEYMGLFRGEFEGLVRRTIQLLQDNPNPDAEKPALRFVRGPGMTEKPEYAPFTMSWLNPGNGREKVKDFIAKYGHFQPRDPIPSAPEASSSLPATLQETISATHGNHKSPNSSADDSIYPDLANPGMVDMSCLPKATPESCNMCLTSSPPG